MKPETRVGLFILAAIAVFLYLSLNIKAIRFDKHQYSTYKAYFDDTGGLTVKASVKIAGVDVGWVENIELLDNGKAEVIMRINKNNRLAKNAYAMIHQDGLIGTKTLEIDPGDPSPSTGILLPGGTLTMPGKTPASVGELLDQFRDIATTIHDITGALKSVFASRQGEEQMKQALKSIAKASDRLADFSEILNRTMKQNEEKISTMIDDFKETAKSLKREVPAISSDVHKVSDTISTDFHKASDSIGTDFHNASDSITKDFNKIADTVSTGFSKASDNLGAAGKKASSAFEHIEDGAIQAKDTFREAGQVMEKINTGKGVIGKLINEDEAYTDLKKTIKGFKEYVGKTQSLLLNIDMHTESFLRNSNSKGYFELRLRPNSDNFYTIQLVGDERGAISRETSYFKRKDSQGNIINASDLEMKKKVEFPDQLETVVQKKNALLFGLQFGKRFDRLAFRVGLFENTFGAGVDYYVPLSTDKLHWITSLEMFDLTGANRLNDTRPHIKWINKAFFLRNFYTTFGVDDICSKRDANPFIGGGLRFGDDDLKYFLSYISPAKQGK